MNQDDPHLAEDARPLQSTPVFLYGKSKLGVKVMCLKLRLWWTLILVLLALIFILCIGCLGSHQWMNLGEGSLSIEGGLLRCNDCPDAWDQSSYDEIAHYLSDSSYSSELSDLFKDLRDGGAAYIFFELLSLLFLNLWAGSVMLMLMNRDENPKVKLLLYVWPGCALFFHFLALVIWAGVSEAKFDEDCSGFTLMDKGKPTVCAGPALALSVATLLFYLIVLAVFYFVFCKAKRMESLPKEGPPAGLDQAQNSPNAPPAYSNVPPSFPNQPPNSFHPPAPGFSSNPQYFN